jgi:hypothetical protein
MQLPDLSDWLEDRHSIRGISCAALRRSLFFSFDQAVPEEFHDEHIIKNEIVAAASRLKQEPAKYLPVDKEEIAKQRRRFDQVFVVGELFRVRYVGIRSRGK